MQRENAAALDPRLFPRECRESGSTYKGALQLDVVIEGPDESAVRIPRRFGHFPVMVGSAACHLSSSSRDELSRRREEDTEFGGYFLCNGNERVVRMLIATRRHYIMALNRGAYTKRGPNYTPKATLLRCVRPDLYSATVRCHYLTDGASCAGH